MMCILLQYGVFLFAWAFEMREIENNLLIKFETLHQAKLNNASRMYELSREIDSLLEYLQNEPFGTTTPEFIVTPALRVKIESESWNKSQYFWYLMNCYISTKDIKPLERFVKKELRNYKAQLLTGVCLPPEDIFSPKTIQYVYLSKDEALIDLFRGKLPLPKADLFKGSLIPEPVEKERLKIEQSIHTFLDKHNVDELITVQRHFRAKIRQREELFRVKRRYSDHIAWNQVTAESMLIKANEPYVPCCEKILSDRIVHAAAKVTLFTTVSHLTASSAVEGIFNDALYGRRSLLQGYMEFRGAALMQCDVNDGDANVVCLGPQYIDPRAIKKNTVKIEFDVLKLTEKHNPSIFYKQKDLGYVKILLRKISFPEGKAPPFYFTHTEMVRCGQDGFSNLQLMSESGSLYAVSELPNVSLIAYDVPNMQQMLVLNFFRFLDELMDTSRRSCPHIIHELYENIGRLTDDELVVFLTDLGRQCSDTAEFNFYGAHKIDFSTIISIMSHYADHDKSYRLELTPFISELESGQLDALLRAKAHLPEVFSSYRFLDYLISKITHQDALYALQTLRETCVSPSWAKKLSQMEFPKTAIPSQEDKSEEPPISGLPGLGVGSKPSMASTIHLSFFSPEGSTTSTLAAVKNEFAP